MRDTCLLAGALVLFSIFGASPVRADVPKVVISAAKAEPDPVADLRKQQEQLNLENNIAELQVRRDLARLTAEKQRRELESIIAQQKLQAEIAGAQAEI